MATVKAFIRVSGKNKERAKVRFRLADGRDIQLFFKSELEVEPKVWDEKNQCIKAKIVYDSDKRKEFNKSVDDLKHIILDVYSSSNKETMTSEALHQFVDEKLHPDKYLKPADSFFGTFDLFLQKRKLSDVRKKNFMVLKRALQRYEMFIAINERRTFKLDFETISADTLEDFESFIRNEHTLYEEFKDMYDRYPAGMTSNKKIRAPKPRGHNTICTLFHKLRAFFNWCNEQEITSNKPFAKYEGDMTEKYGRPVYITLEERNQIADFDLSARPQLEAQRDIFIFQCLIGCRVSDLWQMTQANIINGAIEYIPHKTQDERPHVVRVPLNDRAKALVKKYKGVDEAGKLFPFISQQQYNYSVKDAFQACGINRMVTVVNSVTGKEEKRPIWEVASSHMARRTFVGNLYKKVKDPNLVGSLSGHKEGSKAFARYRDIDDEMKNELVKMIE